MMPEETISQSDWKQLAESALAALDAIEASSVSCHLLCPVGRQLLCRTLSVALSQIVLAS